MCAPIVSNKTRMGQGLKYKTGIIAILFFILVAGTGIDTLSARPQGESVVPHRTVTVVGQGTVQGKPDIAEAQIGVITSSRTVKEAIDRNVRIMDGVLEALRNSGIEDRYIQTSSYSIYFEQNQIIPPSTDQSANEESRITDGVYRATNMVRVTIHDLQAIGTILNAAITAGANNIWGVDFRLADSEKLLEEARTKAMKNAEEKAAELARLADLSLGRIISVSEIIDSSPHVAEGLGGSQGFGIGTISPGELGVVVRLRVAFEVH